MSRWSTVAPQNITLGTTIALAAALAVLFARWESATLVWQHLLKVEPRVPVTLIPPFNSTILH